MYNKTHNEIKYNDTRQFSSWHTDIEQVSAIHSRQVQQSIQAIITCTTESDLRFVQDIVSDITVVRRQHYTQTLRIERMSDIIITITISREYLITEH